MLEIKGISKIYMTESFDQKALDNVNSRGYLTPTQSHRNRHKYRYKTIIILLSYP